ncbi:GNAT family N-acetyltransferase [Hyphomonas sp.]|uniref:GNAT family N-acetyltransferase n=1 Tax=Hyphomonas sp. TaxID=87 RepID=UPI0025BBDC4F|nr:GNAT family N-acetyltransferase [Hyphomonas sp.]
MEEPGTELRSYRDADWPDLCRIHDAARLHELRFSVGVAAFRTLEQTARPEGLFDGALIVLEEQGKVRGFVAFTREELTWLYVDPAHYRRGYGRQLLQHAIKHSGSILKTQVLEGNAPALALYVSAGFQVTERKSGSLVGVDSFPAVGLLLELRQSPAQSNIEEST